MHLLLALEAPVVQLEGGPEVDGEEVLRGGEGEGGVLVVVPAQPGDTCHVSRGTWHVAHSGYPQVILLPGPVWRHQDVVVVAAVAGLGAHVATRHLDPPVVLDT